MKTESRSYRKTVTEFPVKASDAAGGQLASITLSEEVGCLTIFNGTGGQWVQFDLEDAGAVLDALRSTISLHLVRDRLGSR